MPEARPPRILDFDIESLNGGYTDPAFTPDKITAAAWAWAGSDKIHVACDPLGFFDRGRRRELLLPLLAAIDEADELAGHNIIRFDLPSLNAECMRLDLPPLKPKLVWDTIRLPKTKGFKKGQDNIGSLLGVPVRKRSLNWQEWDDAYAEGAPWPTVRDRVASDVRQHRLIFAEMKQRGWLRTPRMWNSRAAA